MKSPCVTYPEHEPLVLIRASQVRLCDGNHCAAALLSYFGYWHSIRLEQTQQAEHANKVAALHGEQGTQETTLLQYHTEEEIETGLLHLYGRKTIRTAIAVLVSKGFVSIHGNPNPRYRFDKTHYFLFHPDAVHTALSLVIHEVKMPDREGKNTLSDFTGQENGGNVNSKHSVHEVKMPDREGPFASSPGKNAAPIAEITSEITEEKENPLAPLATESPETGIQMRDESPQPQPTSRLTPEWLVALYNAKTPEKHPKVKELSEGRRKKALLRLRQFPQPAFWETVMDEINKSPLLLGLRPSSEHPNWRGDFDWLLGADKNGTENCVKAAEGKYRDRSISRAGRTAL